LMTVGKRKCNYIWHLALGPSEPPRQWVPKSSPPQGKLTLTWSLPIFTI